MRFGYRAAAGMPAEPADPWVDLNHSKKNRPREAMRTGTDP
jgi:hypothetical protein